MLTTITHNFFWTNILKCLFRWFFRFFSLFTFFEAWRVRSAILDCFYDCFSFFFVTQQAIIHILSRLHWEKQMNKNWCNRISTKDVIKRKKTHHGEIKTLIVFNKIKIKINQTKHNKNVQLSHVFYILFVNCGYGK